MHILFGVDALLWCACVPSGRVLMGEQRCRHGAGNQRNRFEKGAARVNLCTAYVSCAVSAATPATHVCVCVSKDTTYAHGDMPTHDFVDTRGRGRWQGPWLHLSGIYWFAKPATAADGASVHPGKD